MVHVLYILRVSVDGLRLDLLVEDSYCLEQELCWPRAAMGALDPGCSATAQSMPLATARRGEIAAQGSLRGLICFWLAANHHSKLIYMIDIGHWSLGRGTATPRHQRHLVGAR